MSEHMLHKMSDSIDGAQVFWYNVYRGQIAEKKTGCSCLDSGIAFEDLGLQKRIEWLKQRTMDKNG